MHRVSTEELAILEPAVDRSNCEGDAEKHLNPEQWSLEHARPNALIRRNFFNGIIYVRDPEPPAEADWEHEEEHRVEVVEEDDEDYVVR